MEASPGRWHRVSNYVGLQLVVRGFPAIWNLRSSYSDAVDVFWYGRTAKLPAMVSGQRSGHSPDRIRFLYVDYY